MRIKEVPLLEDNYGYLLIDEATNTAAVIDPAEPEKVVKAAEVEGVTITMVLTTHKHWDHAGGNKKIAGLLGPGVPIVGGKVDGVEACSRVVEDGDTLTLGQDTHITCLHTPGHTMGHICYYVTSGEQQSEGAAAAAGGGAPAVFTGDTLFVGGAGKFFEGSPQDMYTSLYTKLAALPAHTNVYCGHEYTLSNYRFALSLEPHTPALVEENNRATKLREEGLPTIPSTIAKELATNPFMRVDQPAIRERIDSSGQGLSPAQVLGVVREMKNSFRG